MTGEETKFAKEDLPKIIAAAEEAHRARKRSVLTVYFTNNGGCIGIELNTTDKYK